MLSICVLYQPRIMIDQTLGEYTVRYVFVKLDGTHIELHDLPTAQVAGVRDVEIKLLFRFLTIKLRLPKNVKSALILYLRHYHDRERPRMNCYAFGNHATRVFPHWVRYQCMYWEKRRKPFFMKPGHVVFFETGENEFIHAAVYIGYGLYLSVYGGGGDIEITTLADMKKAYIETDRVVLAVPITK